MYEPKQILCISFTTYHPIHEYKCPNKREDNSKQNITPHANVWMKMTKIIRRMESQIVGSKIIRQTDGRMES